MNRQKRILMLLSSVDAMGISGKQTGTWFHEVAAPYYLLTKAGFEVVFASPDGGDAPIDLLSMKAPFTSEYTEKFLKDDVAIFALQNTRQLNNINYDTFDALFVPGGYGLLWDLASNSFVIKMVKDFYESNRLIAMVCHAPAILRDVKKSNGEYLVKGVELTGFKNAEDDEIELSRHLLFSLEDELKNRGAHYKSTSTNWEAHVVQDKNLITGQNPASAILMTELMINLLKDNKTN